MATRFHEGLGMTFGLRGGDGSPHARGHGGGAVMATRFLEGLGMTFGSRGGDGSPHARGHGEGAVDGDDEGTRNDHVPLRGEDGSPMREGTRDSLRDSGHLVRDGSGIGLRMCAATRNDVWVGMVDGGWVPACARTRRGAVMATRFLEGLGMAFGSRGGDGSPHARGHGEGGVDGDGRFANRPYGERR